MYGKDRKIIEGEYAGSAGQIVPALQKTFFETEMYTGLRSPVFIMR